MSIFNLLDEQILLHLKKFDLNNLCRSCLCKNVPLIHDSNKSKTLSQNPSSYTNIFFHKYLNILISDDKRMPCEICESCMSQLSIAYIFLQQCEKANKILVQFLNSKDEKIIDESHFFIENNVNFNLPESNEMIHADGKSAIDILSSKIRRKKNCKLKKKLKSIQIFPKTINGSLSDDSTAEVNDSIYLGHKSRIGVKNESNVIDEDREENEQPISCESSEKIFTSDSDLLEHSKTYKKSFQCATCGYSFRTARGLQVHERGHSGLARLQCGACGRGFSDERTLRHHRQGHEGAKPFQCSYCHRKFSQKKPLQYHEKTHTGERPHVCDVCGKSYIQPNSLVIHRRTHTGEKPFVCQECGKAFTNGASLTLHMPVHTGVKDFVCTICGKRMARSGELTIHMRTHTGEKPYVCRSCPKAFIKKSSLQAHMYSHTGEKKFVCPICGHRVAQAGKLTVHMRTHSSAKPFACPVCDRRFANQGYLKQHSKIHAGDRVKPYVCSQCNRSFTKNKNLTEHMRTHTGERPFPCLVCNYGFSQRSTLNIHMKNAHGEPKSRRSSKENMDDQNTHDVAAPEPADIYKDNTKTDQQIVIKNKAQLKKDFTENITVVEKEVLDDSLQAKKFLNKMEVPSVPASVIHINHQEFPQHRSTAGLTDGSHVDIKTGFDQRTSYDPRLLGFLHYPT